MKTWHYNNEPSNLTKLQVNCYMQLSMWVGTVLGILSTLLGGVLTQLWIG